MKLGEIADIKYGSVISRLKDKVYEEGFYGLSEEEALDNFLLEESYKERYNKIYILNSDYLTTNSYVGEINPSKYIWDKELPESFSRALLKKDDIVISSAPPYNLALFRNVRQKVLVPSYFSIIRLKTNNPIISEYISIYLYSEHGREQIWKALDDRRKKDSSDGKTKKSKEAYTPLSSSVLLDFDIPIPDIYTVKLIVAMFNKTNEVINNLRLLKDREEKLTNDAFNFIIDEYKKTLSDAASDDIVKADEKNE